MADRQFFRLNRNVGPCDLCKRKVQRMDVGRGHIWQICGYCLMEAALEALALDRVNWEVESA